MFRGARRGAGVGRQERGILRTGLSLSCACQYQSKYATHPPSPERRSDAWGSRGRGRRLGKTSVSGNPGIPLPLSTSSRQTAAVEDGGDPP